MGLATTLLFGDSTETLSIMQTLVGISLSIGTFVCIPLVLISFSSGISSLRKDRLSGRVTAATILWSILTAIVLPLLAVVAYSFFSVKFPVTSSAGQASYASELITLGANTAFNSIAGNPFYIMAVANSFLLPLIVVAWIFGVALQPNVDVIKPAYVTLNSFSEVMFRIARTYSVIGYLLTYCTSTFFFTQLYQEKTVFVSGEFILTVLSIALVLGFIILPLLYAILSKGKNPYRIIFRNIPSQIIALTSGNILLALPIMESEARHNSGVQKRIAATTMPLFVIIGKAGSAALAAISVSSILYAATGEMPQLSILCIIALASAAASFLSSSALGYEVMFIAFLALKMTNITLYGAEMTLVALAPFVGGLGIMVDAIANILGTAFAGQVTGTNVKTVYEDIL